MNRLENWFCASRFWRRMSEQRWLPWLLQDVNLGEHVLEVGAGPGAATAELVRRVGRVTSLEYSHNFCVMLRSEMGAPGVVQGDATALPFRSGTFTSAIAILVLHHLRSAEAQDAALAEISRVLRPGGRFAALEINDVWLTRALHCRSTFVPVSSQRVAAKLTAIGFAKVDIELRSGGFALRAEKRKA
jgi:ubiquinone/menaquinone biosynthesis C-methylase UbiE